MSVSPISSPHPTPHVTTDATRTQNQPDTSAANSGDRSTTPPPRPEDSRPTQSSHTAPGTGLTVDKRV